jgi:anti-sigma factor RsiW
MTHDDPTLVAYLDGQLDEAQCAAIEAALPHDEALRARLDALARASELAQRCLEPVLREPIPPALIAAIWRAPDPRAAGRAAKTPGLRERLAAWLPAPRLALASLVLVAGLGWLVLRPGGGALAPGDTLAGSALSLALDTAASGETLRTREAALELLGSFVAADGRACRAFQQRRDGTDTLAIACRDAAADAWRVAFAQARPIEAEAGYQPASDPRTEAADAFLRDTLRATALDAGEERGFIARGWDR